MSISFEGIGEICATFFVDQSVGIVPLSPCTITENNTVAFAFEDERFIGWVVNTTDDCCAVQLNGYVESAYSGTDPEVGYSHLLSDGLNGVCVDSGTDGVYTGGEYLIVKVDTTNNIVGFFL